ncbi:hypothetical protein D5086_029348 [Populus alba]|uniref:Uncharacterized protein n=1 Tax=Populus alba TaxID=43335 RepID=A0ACC4AT83_POPAL
MITSSLPFFTRTCWALNRLNGFGRESYNLDGILRSILFPVGLYREPSAGGIHGPVILVLRICVGMELSFCVTRDERNFHGLDIITIYPAPSVLGKQQVP